MQMEFVHHHPTRFIFHAETPLDNDLLNDIVKDQSVTFKVEALWQETSKEGEPLLHLRVVNMKRRKAVQEATQSEFREQTVKEGSPPQA